MKKYVITGGPCSGKTTTCEELSLLGYTVVPEASRLVQRLETQRNNPILPSTDFYAFQLLTLEIEQSSKLYRYSGIFFLEQLPDYKQDTIRIEDAKAAQQLSELLKKTYTELGYSSILVPVMPQKERALFIVEHIKL